MKILGIDPGYDRVGWGVLDKTAGQYRYVACGAVETKKTMSIVERLMIIEEELTAVIATHQPTVAVVESLFFATNAKTAINVAQARGVIMLTLAKYIATVQEMTPLQIKSSVTGDGHADKKAVEKMVRLQLRDLPLKLLDDTLDALAAALSI